MRRALPAVAALAAMLLLPASAAAKGPSVASISGPGLDHAIVINGYGEGGNASPLGVLVDQGGFFHEVYGQTNTQAVNHRPAGDLGPRYEVTYTVPGEGGDSTLKQELYPYARSGPVTYMTPMQKFWGTQLTPGGWFRGSPQLRRVLVDAGLPATAVRRRASNTTIRVALGAGAGVALAAVGLGLYYRRRTATT